jgi:beta-glucosidase
MMDYDIRHGRTYMYFQQKPLYAFGYGLSYTTFDYAHLALSADTLHSASDLRVIFDLRNTGQRAGDEVAQLYVTHIGSKVPRAAEELKGFERVHLAAGASKKVTIVLPANALRYWDSATSQWVLEPDQVEIRIASSSDNIRLRKTISVAP